MRWLGFGERDRVPAAPLIDPETVRDEMTRSDPDYREARHWLHEARGTVTIKRNNDIYAGLLADEQRRAQWLNQARAQTHDRD